jgi:phage shock protein C
MPAESSPPRRLYRSSKNRIVAGVCGGIAEYLNVDPTLIRLGFVLLTIASGSGILLYLILAIIVPKAPAGATYPTPPPLQVNAGAVILLLVGLGLVVLGVIWALDQVAPWFWPFWNLWSIVRGLAKFFWAALLIVIGLAVIAAALRRR